MIFDEKYNPYFFRSNRSISSNDTKDILPHGIVLEGVGSPHSG